MLVSVYMPTRNRLELVSKAINSVLNQSYTNIELIVVDDGSTDGTESLLQTLSQADSRLRYIRLQSSKGGCHARNLAIRAASGIFITGLDDDDEFTTHHIASLVDYWHLLKRYSHESISCIYVQYLDRNQTVIHETRKPSKVVHSDLFDGNYVGNQIFAPREHYIEAGLFNEAMPAWQDLEFFYRVLKMYGPARLLDSASYIFDVAPRHDRISIGKKRVIVEASKKMIDLHADGDVRITQRLLLQLYAEYYSFEVTAKEYLEFVRVGWWPAGYQKLFNIMIKRRLRCYKAKLKASLKLGILGKFRSPNQHV